MWAENGSLTADQRAAARWRQMLADYKAPPMERELRAALSEFVNERKASMPDEWY